MTVSPSPLHNLADDLLRDGADGDERTRAARLEQVARATAGALILPDSAGDCPGVAADRAPRGLFLSVVDFLRSPHKPDQITEAWE